MKREPWHDCPNVFKDEKAFLSWLRSQTRRIWSKHPIKIEYKKSLRYKAPVGRNDKEVFVIDCEMCGKPCRDTQTDHLHGGYGFKDWQTFTEWAKMILWVTFDDIRELCHTCHSHVTLSQKLNIPLADAIIESEVIALCKQKASDQDKFLAKNGISGYSRNAVTRRNLIREVLKNGK